MQKLGWTKPPPGAQLNRQHPQANGLAACWLFNESYGTVAREMVRNTASALSFSGSIHTQSWVGSPTGRLAINGENLGTPIIARVLGFEENDSVTFECFTRVPTNPGYDTCLVISGSSDAIIVADATNELKYYANNTTATYSSGIELVEGTWYHIVVVFVAGSRVDFYINGQLASSVDATGDIPLWSSGANLQLITAFLANGHDGIFDFIRIWFRQLGPADVAALYAQPFAMFQPTRAWSYYSGPESAIAVRPLERMQYEGLTSRFVPSDSQLNRGRQAWWLCLPHLMGGRTWFDITGSGNHATLHTPTWSATNRRGAFGQVKAASGTIPLLNVGRSFTVSWWAMQTMLNSNLQGIDVISKNVSLGSHINRFGLSRQTNAGVDNTYITGEVMATQTYGYSPTPSGLAHKVHCLVTVDDTRLASNKVRVYRDGVQLLDQDIAMISGDVTFDRIFTYFGSAVSNSGYLDDVSVWDRTLTDGEVKTLYRDSLTGYKLTLKEYSPVWYMVPVIGSSTRTTTLFLCNIIPSTTGSIPLYLPSYSSGTLGATLFEKGHNYVDKACTLFISTMDSENESFPLYILGEQHRINNSTTLFLANSGDKLSAFGYMPLVIQRQEADAKSIPLYLRGPGSGITQEATLFTFGVNTVSKTSPLTMPQTYGQASGDKTLFVEGMGVSTQTATLHTMGNTFGVSMPLWIAGRSTPADKATTLFVANSGDKSYKSGSMPLVIWRTPAAANSVPLYLRSAGDTQSATAPLYVNSNNILSKNTTLALPGAVGASGKKATVYVHGF